MTGFTNFSSEPTEQEGNYLALKFDYPEGTTTTVEIVGGTKGAVTLDEDKNWVGLIKNKDSQSIKVIAKRDIETVEKIYALTGMILESKSV